MLGFIRFLIDLRRFTALAGLVILLAFCVAGLLAPAFYSWTSVTAIDLSRSLRPPGWGLPLGADEMGRDLLGRIIWGARATLTVALISVLVSAFSGIVLGTAAGYYTGYLSAILVRVIDAMVGFPRILIAIVLLTIFGAGLVGLTLAIAISTMPVFARLYFTEVQSLRTREFVNASLTLGASDLRLICLHVLPNTRGMLMVQASIALAEAVLIASGLSFLGMGPQPPTPEWGAMIAGSRAHIFSSPHVVFAPGAALFLVILSFNVLGDATRDYFDPKTNKKRSTTT